MINPRIFIGEFEDKNENKDTSSIYEKPEYTFFGVILTLLGSVCFSSLASMTILVKGKCNSAIML